MTIFNGKIHYKWPFSIVMLVYQRVIPIFKDITIWCCRVARWFPIHIESFSAGWSGCGAVIWNRLPADVAKGSPSLCSIMFPAVNTSIHFSYGVSYGFILMGLICHWLVLTHYPININAIELWWIPSKFISHEFPRWSLKCGKFCHDQLRPKCFVALGTTAAVRGARWVLSAFFCFDPTLNCVRHVSNCDI